MTGNWAPVRMGLVGYGIGGRVFHAPLLASASEVDFLGVVTGSPRRRDDVAADLPGRRTFDDLAALAEAGAEAVAISTPAHTHLPLVLQALRLGLGVVCDKPFTLDAAAARTAVDEADSRGLPLTVYQNRRWDSDFATVAELVRAEALGRVRRFESAFERFAPVPGPPAAGAGTLLDFGSHLVDQALHLFGPVQLVYAELGRMIDDGLDDDVLLALTHTSGVRSLLSGSWVQGAPRPRFRITGQDGAYEVGGMDVQESLLFAGHTPAELGPRWGVEPMSRRSVIARGDESVPVPLRRGRWDAFYPAFAQAVRGAGPVPVDPRDAVATAVVLDAARRSAVTGAAVHLVDELPRN